MKLIGSYRDSGMLYYVVLQDIKGSSTWYLVSEVHPEDYSKKIEQQRARSLNLANFADGDYSEYILEAMVHSKVTGKVKAYRGLRRVNKIFDSFILARDLSYPKESVLTSNESYEGFGVTKNFKASYNGYSIDLSQSNGIYSKLGFTTPDFELNLDPFDRLKMIKGLVFKEVNKHEAYKSEVLSVNQITVEYLANKVNLDWYRDSNTNEKRKNYISIDNVNDFESKFITPMIRCIQREIAMGIRPLISCDTETTGFNLLNLLETNPIKDHISTIQFAWEENQGVLIHLGMKFFDNVNVEYVFSRLKELFGYTHNLRFGKTLPRGKKDGSLYFRLLRDEEGNSIKEDLTLNRNDYDLVAHNAIFDSRATLSSGAQFYFDHDTLQMAFNIDPTVTKGSKGLKRLTRYFFDEETPDLVDILGKGNEGKFHLINSREVEEIYGCADVDYTRKLFYALRKLMSDKMFNSYKTLDPITWYVCAQSEYFGMKLDMDGVIANADIITKDLVLIKEVIYKYVGHMLNLKSRLSLMSESNLFSFEESSFEESSNKYIFDLTNNEIGRVMYKLLDYPVTVVTAKTGSPAVNQKAFKQLKFYKNKSGVKLLQNDILSSDGESTLISEKDFNSYKYPLVYLITLYRTLDKEYSTYYGPFMKEDKEGKLFKPIKTTNIETRRLSSAAQIIKKSLKKRIMSYGEEWYIADWDQNQVESRIFTSLANDTLIIEKLKDCEKDVHTESASLIFNVEAHLVSKDDRNSAKTIGFGIPYGLSTYSMEERLYTVHNEENGFKTRVLEKKFEDANEKSMSFLNAVRDKALVPVDVSPELKRFWGLEEEDKVGLVYNEHGFYRYFPLTNVLGNKKFEGSVRRAAGNYPIQSFAADLYRVILKRFYDRLIVEGIQDKVIFHMYIHDELLFSVHKSIDPRFIAKLAAEECMLQLKGHTSYFIGLGFGKTWYEAKSDDNEIPTKLLLRIAEDYDSYTDIQDWTDNARDFMDPKRTQFKKGRILEVVESIQPGYLENSLNIKHLIESFSNYAVRSYLYEIPNTFGTRKKTVGYSEVEDEDDKFVGCLVNLLVDQGLGDCKIEYDNVTITAKELLDLRGVVEGDVEIKLFKDDFYEDQNEFEDNLGEFFANDDSEYDDYYRSSYGDYQINDTEFEDFKKDVVNKYVRRLGHNYIVQIPNLRKEKKILQFLDSFRTNTGEGVRIESIIGTKKLNGKFTINESELEKFIEEASN